MSLPAHDVSRWKNMSSARNAPEGWFQSGNTAEMGRYPNASGGVATYIQRGTPHCENRSRAAAAASRRSRKIIRIMGTTVDEIFRIIRKRQFGCVCFSEDDRPRCP